MEGDRPKQKWDHVSHEMIPISERIVRERLCEDENRSVGEGDHGGGSLSDHLKDEMKSSTLIFQYSVVSRGYGFQSLPLY
jgi:hypothetical protein